MVTNNSKMKMEDNILAFILLDNAKLTEDERKLAFTAIATLGISFKTMKSALKRVFTSLGGSSENNVDGMAIKQEEAFYTKQHKKFPRKKHNNSKSKSHQKLNPLDDRGRVSRCVICDSKMHWADRCQHSDENQYVNLNEVSSTECKCCGGCSQSVESVNFVLMTEQLGNNENNENSLMKQEILLAEASKSAIVDTACTKTVAGEKWFAQYCDQLSDENEKRVKLLPSHTPFKFGDGRTVFSNGKAIIPANVAGKECTIEAEVVSENIPLLLSKSSLKRAGTVIDLQSDSAKMFGNEVKLHQSTAGHYCVHIFPDDELNYDAHPENDSTEQNVLYNEQNICEDITPEEVHALESSLPKDVKVKQITKLHKQFAHCSAANLKKLIKTANDSLLDSDLRTIIDDVIDRCEICSRYKKPAPRPIVGFNKSCNFNDNVSMDLHQLATSVWYIHFLDDFTKYSNAVVIYKKDISGVAFMKCWISNYGAPNKVHSDNGGEFISDEFMEICEMFNIKLTASPAYAPWSNGPVERHNQTLSTMVLKVKDEVHNCSWEVAVAWSVSAKNALFNYLGFSPAQLVFGKNINLPSLLTNDLPALEDPAGCKSKHVSMHVFALEAARQAYASVESYSKINLALRKQVRPSGIVYQIGEKVFYKRDDSPRWKGPATVLGHENCVVFLRHGSRYIKAHACRVRHATEPDTSVQMEVNSKVNQAQSSNKNCSKNVTTNAVSSDSDEESSVDQTVKPTSSQIGSNAETSSKTSSDAGASSQSKTLSNAKDRVMLKKNQKVSFFEKNNDQQFKATVLGNAGKKSGPLKNWYNIEYSYPASYDGKQISKDLDCVEDLTIINDDTSQILCVGSSEDIFEVSQDVFYDAKQDELKNWERNQVYEKVRFTGQKCLSVRWVCTMKSSDTGLKPKARLVARGFEEDSSEIEKDSPTCSKDTLRAMLAVASQKGWAVGSIDIKTAFLQGKHIQRTVYLYPPPEANVEQGFVWLLKKCVYGLSDASLHWFERVKTFLISIDGVSSRYDAALFCWYEKGELIGIIIVHVDDFLHAGTESFQVNVIANLRKTFLIGKEETSVFQYLGMKLKQTHSCISVDQNAYASSILEIPLNSEMRKDINAQIPDTLKDTMRSRIGQLLWIANQTRPDLSFGVSSLAVKLKSATYADVMSLNKIIRRAKSVQTCTDF